MIINNNPEMKLRKVTNHNVIIKDKSKVFTCKYWTIAGDGQLQPFDGLSHAAEVVVLVE